MTKKLLIDTTHSEETRVAVVDDNHLEEFDYENKVRKQLKGNIFLAQVTRVEPSLQAAFVNFGGNRHGFLPFSEIHPDYFRVPVEDREALQNELAEEAEKQRAEEEREDYEAQQSDESSEDDDLDEEDEDADSSDENNGSKGNKDSGGKKARGGSSKKGGNRKGRPAKSKSVEVIGGDDEEETRTRRPNLRKKYKIQEVIKRGQIMLIQVSKEERGNKGAAVTSYISLAGRYCVLMPNSPRAGGVSRKIPSYKERKRMRAILKEMKIPDGMSVIVRTAGVGRTKAEIKRDLNYLVKLWDQIREDTLQSSAPAEIHEEANLIKRAIRDLYTRDIDEVYVAGEEGYKEAKNFMKLMIPSHSKKVQLYKDERIPLFHRYQVESQISAIGDPVASMKSGGYLVINPTEALVSVDVNSGRATKGRHIEETALKTNLEAADEVARQLRLRDLGGLVVVDFIDMEDRRNNRKVEKRMRDALSKDRARIQVGRISNFGLMELSRQRLNPSLTEAQFQQCPACKGVGVVRTLESATLNLIRELEEEGIKDRSEAVKVQVPNDVALYILNNKRSHIAEIEERYGFVIEIEVNNSLSMSDYEISPVKSGGKPQNQQESSLDEKDQKSGRARGGRGKGQRGDDHKADSKQDDKSRRRKPRASKNDQKQDRNSGTSSKETSKDSAQKTEGESKGSGRTKPEDSKAPSGAQKKSSGNKKPEQKADKGTSGASSKDKDAAKDVKKPDSKKQEADTKESKSAPKKSDEEKAKKADGQQDNKPAKSHPDEKVTVIPDTAEAQASKSGKSSKRKGWWNRLVDG